MRIPDDVFTRYQITDVDVQAFLSFFDEPKGYRVLEVGAHDEPCANILADFGYDVSGVDLREYNSGQDLKGSVGLPCNYNFIRGDFCDMPDGWLRANVGTFDCIYSLSAIEHFGLGAYEEGAYHPFYDVIAARLMWQLLRVGGSCYVSVPFLSYPVEVRPHWRAYSMQELVVRLVQDFRVEYLMTFAADDVVIDGKVYRRSDNVPAEEAIKFSGTHCNISVLMKLRKVPAKRLAPDGR